MPEKRPSWLEPHKYVFFDMTEEDLLARCMYGEARGEPYEGKFAVGCVIRNRVLTPSWWGRNYRRVILNPWQFSCFNKDQLNNLIPSMLNPTDKANFDECKKAAKAILSGEPDITGGATHYFADYIKPPAWAERMVKTCVIGRHIFYNELGNQ